MKTFINGLTFKSVSENEISIGKRNFNSLNHILHKQNEFSKILEYIAEISNVEIICKYLINI
jgi:hypothetical protein